MCGITGWIDWDCNLIQQKDVLERMTSTLAPRGPDASGIWLSQQAALGHRRLIVVDPAGGKQPMIRQQGNNTYVLTYNGELYNTPELRRELEQRGHLFQSHSDTEVLLVAFIEWGAACVEQLNGIFAFAIWSATEQKLFMARDRLGVKPLFYKQQGPALLFGSELKALLAHPSVKPKVSAEGLAEIFVLGPSRTPGHGVFDNIHELKPGHCLLYDHNGLRLQRYWNLVSHPHTDNLNITSNKIKTLLKDAVDRQLVADVPVCTLLSGGLDSSALTALAVENFRASGTAPLHTYSVDYLDNDRYFKSGEFQPNSDAPWAQRVSKHLKTHPHYITIDTPQLVNALTTAVHARDLPCMADVDASLYLFSREIKKNATVALSGECADEIFGGYPWFHNQETLNATTFPWLRDIQTRTSLLSTDLLKLIKPQEYLQQRYLETLAEVPKLSGESLAACRQREMFYLNMTWFMSTLLERKDRMSMYTGLEVRVPFCDHRLVEYAWNIPWEMKSCDHQEKGILRRALAGLLPDEVLKRRKSPYPKTHNPNYLAAVKKQLTQILDDPNAPLLPLINVPAVRSLTQLEGDTFNRPWFGQLMTGPQLFAYLCQVNIWLKEYQVDFEI